MTTHAQQQAEQQIDEAFRAAGMPRAERRTLIHRLKNLGKGMTAEELDELLDEVFPPSTEIEDGLARLRASLRSINRSH